MKILFAIISCHKNALRRQAQRDTWVPFLNADYKFFLGDGDSELKPDEVQLECPDHYEGLPEKVQAVCRWALENEYDYICKVDDDVYIFPERLLKSEFREHAYSGRLNGSRGPSFPNGYCSGFTYWINAKCAEILANAKTDPKVPFEDVWVGSTLTAAGIPIYETWHYAILQLPRNQWPAFFRQWLLVVCQFEPEDMYYAHKLTRGVFASDPGRPKVYVQPPIPPAHGARLTQTPSPVIAPKLSPEGVHKDLRTGRVFGQRFPKR